MNKVHLELVMATVAESSLNTGYVVSVNTDFVSFNYHRHLTWSMLTGVICGAKERKTLYQKKRSKTYSLNNAMVETLIKPIGGWSGDHRLHKYH